MALLELADDLWMADGPTVDFYGFPYPTRMVVARLPDGLWVWSPIPLAPELRAEIDALGPVKWLVEPNKIHHLFMTEWHAAYPDARLCGTEQLVAKRDDLSFAITLGDEPPTDWAEHIDQVMFHGSVVMQELVFFHRRSRTAIFGDLIENFDQAWLDTHWKRWQAPIARFAGIVAPDGKAPVDFRSSFLRRAPAREALAKVRSWAPERVIMAHGQTIASDGLAFIDRSFAWLDP